MQDCFITVVVSHDDSQFVLMVDQRQVELIVLAEFEFVIFRH